MALHHLRSLGPWRQHLHLQALAVFATVVFALGVLLSSCSDERSGESGGDSHNAQHSSAGSGAIVLESDDAALQVHVTGAVHDPGLHELETGSRIADAIEMAGGFADDAAVEALNLARVLVDGEQIVVPRIGEQDESRSDGAGSSDAGSSAESSRSSRIVGSEAGGDLVNLNSATADLLQSLPGVGPSTALKIIDSRVADGPFRTVDDLTRISGIGDKTVEKLRSRATV